MRISVVIPCYNVEGYVKECLDSILAQDHADLEVICVDDGSTDGTVASLRAIQEGPRGEVVRVIEQANQGAAAARNRGLKEASGEYIQFMDADDLLHPRKIGHQVRLAVKAGRPDLIVGSFEIIDPKNQVLQERYYTKRKGDVWMHLMRTDLGNTISNLWKRSIVEAAGGWDEGMRSSQEYDLMFRILLLDPTVFFDTEQYTTVRKRETGSITQTNLGGNWVRYVNLRLRIIEHIRKHRSDAEMQPFHQFLFDSIRVLYEYDPKAALEFHRTRLPKDFKPTASPTTRGTYLGLYNILGFRATQRLWARFH
ncbi:MAG: glycosyltransferase family 2 protein [Flavobacteriales bacterium]|nr:glycosyltransferase family 2 protein [Flavobacteriales bacterium]